MCTVYVGIWTLYRDIVYDTIITEYWGKPGNYVIVSGQYHILLYGIQI